VHGGQLVLVQLCTLLSLLKTGAMTPCRHGVTVVVTTRLPACLQVLRRGTDALELRSGLLPEPDLDDVDVGQHREPFVRKVGSQLLECVCACYPCAWRQGPRAARRVCGAAGCAVMQAARRLLGWLARCSCAAASSCRKPA
jgi:hypothetical protein